MISSGQKSLPASTERISGAELNQEIEKISCNPVLEGLLEAVHGLMAVLNEHRQILAINDTLLEMLGTKDLKNVLGLRLGETLHCIHAQTAPGGCGTSEFCPSCGAAIAQVTCLTQNHPNEQFCAIEIPGADGYGNLFFRVRASPLMLSGQRYILLFLQDVSREQRAALLEQTFLHDLRNTAMGLSAGATLLADSITGPDNQIALDVLQLADRLTREIDLQRYLAHASINSFSYKPAPLSVNKLFGELERSSQLHPAFKNRTLVFTPLLPDIAFQSDPTLLHRILCNMIINALEAVDEGGKVRVSAKLDTKRVRFAVWNEGCIPSHIALRIFQRNFSTKGTLGRGLGTYAMKLLGEKLLGGRVAFTSSSESGTCFTLDLPV